MIQRCVFVAITTVLFCFLAEEKENKNTDILVPRYDDIFVDNFDKLSCQDRIYGITKRKFTRLSTSTKEINIRKKNNTNICEFAYNTFDSLLFNSFYPHDTNTTWHCEISDISRCNNQSSCLTDECNCSDSPVFYCKDGSGCISFADVCDSSGGRDCLDGSDECMCEGKIHLTCPNLTPQTYCLEPSEWCALKQIASKSLLKNCTVSETTVTSDCTSVFSDVDLWLKMPLVSCLLNVYEDFIRVDRRDEYIATRYCKNNCTNDPKFVEEKWDQYCDHIFLAETSLSHDHFYGDYVFNCEPKPFTMDVTYLASVCDGKKDCENGADEVGCPGRFYCSPNSSIDWVSPEQLCDHVKDCPNGQDECEACDLDQLSSSEFLIESKIILYSTGFAGLVMVILNVFVGVECYKSEPATKPGIVDRIMRLQVIFYDCLMGVYKIMIVIAALVLKSKGRYCLSDQSWRSSIYCSALGVLFSVSSHGSLIIIGFMSIVRCLTCTKAVHEIPKRVVLIVSAVLFTANLINSFIPVLPFATVQNVFRSEAFFPNFKDNPFISSGIVNLTRLDELHYQYYSKTTTFYKTIINLNNITSEEGLFDVIEIGYYGDNRMCTQNIFKNQESYLIYKLVYLLIVFLIVITVAITYIIILYKKVKSHRQLKLMAALQKDNGISSLKTKIILMIGSQLISWMSFIIAAVYYHFSFKNPPPLTFEVFSLVVIPINSILNPIFYSRIYSKLLKLFSRAWNLLVTKLRRFCYSTDSTEAKPNSNEIELQERKK
ncbi:hypothetical protein ACHWQZ_G013532 [Mnemiopsis leidyi]